MKKLNRSKKGYVIAEGEATGHVHTITEKVELFQDGDTKKLRMSKPVPLQHEEHDTQVINPPKKDYITIDTVRQFNHVEQTIEKIKD